MKREKNIELIRIICSILVIVLHLSNNYFYSFNKISNSYFLISVIFNILSRISVPIYFMISGSFLIKEDFNKTKYIKKIKKLLIVIVFWNIFYYIYNGLLFNKNITNNILSNIITWFFTPSKSHLWFLYSIIGLYLIQPFISKMCKNLNEKEENLFIILWLIFSGLKSFYIPISSFITNQNIDIIYPIPLINASYYLGYFILGYILYKRYNKYIKKNINLYCILTYIISSIIMILITYFVSIKTNKLFECMTWYSNILISISSISIYLLVLVNKNKIKNELIPKLSINTLGIYLIHMIFIMITRKCSIIEINPIISIPLYGIIIYFISLIITIIIRKIPLLNKVL